MDELGLELAAMAKVTLDIYTTDNISDEVELEADRALISLMKSMAIYGFNEVTGDQ